MLSLNEILSRLPIKGATKIGGAQYKGQVPILNEQGQLDQSFFHNVNRISVWVAADAAARKALTTSQVQAGDIVVEQDSKKSYILFNVADASQITPAPTSDANWQLLGIAIEDAADIVFDPAYTDSTLTGITNVQEAIEKLDQTTVKKGGDVTITGTPTFDPDPAGPPFIIGSGGTDQKVEGLNADKLDGFDATHFLNRANHTGPIGADVISGGRFDEVTITNANVEGIFSGNVTGDVTGNLTGNVTGDVTGNVTGDLTGNVVAEELTANVAQIDVLHVDTSLNATDATIADLNVENIQVTGSSDLGTIQLGIVTQNFAESNLVTPSAHGFALKEDKDRFDRCECGGFNGPVNTLLVKDQSIYVGGDFTAYGNVPSKGLARVSYSGHFIPEFDITGDHELFTAGIQIEPSENGVFLLTDGSVKHLYKIKKDGTVDTSFATNDIASAIATIYREGSWCLGLLGDGGSTFGHTDESGDAVYYPISNGDGFYVATSQTLAEGKKLFVSATAYSGGSGDETTINGNVNPKGLQLIDIDPESDTFEQIDPTWKTNAGSGAEAGCGKMVIAPGGSYVIVANNPNVHIATDTSWNSRWGNLLKWSEEFQRSTTWIAQGNPVVVDDDERQNPFGTGVNADVIADNSGGVASLSSIEQTVAISTGTRFEFSIFVKKDAVQSRFPLFRMDFTGGAQPSISVSAQLNTSTTTEPNGHVAGQAILFTDVGTGSGTVTTSSVGNYWKIKLSALRKDHTSIKVSIYPAYTDDMGTSADATVTGDITVWGAQLRNTSWGDEYIKTTDASRPASNANHVQYKGFYKIKADGTEYSANDWTTTITVTNPSSDFPIPFAVDSLHRLYFGGPVTSIKNANDEVVTVTPNRLYRLTPTGKFDKEFTLFEGTVNDVALVNDDLLVVGGEFVEYGSVRVGRIVFLNADGKLIHGGAPLSDDTPTSVTIGAEGAPGTSEECSRADHEHPAPGYATVVEGGFMQPEHVFQLANTPIQQSVTICEKHWESVIGELASNTGTGITVSASHENTDAWKALDGKESTIWSTGVVPGGTPAWYKFVFSEAKLIQGYTLKSDNTNPPVSWTFEGSNDGTTWTVLQSVPATPLDSWKEMAGSNVVYVEKKFSFNTESRYTQYRINFGVTSPANYTILLREIKLVEEFQNSKIEITGQELCPVLDIKPNGGIVTSPTGLALDFDIVEKKGHIHANATESASGMQSNKDKFRFNRVIGGGFDAPVRTIEVKGQHIYVGGDFTTYDNVASPKLVKLDKDGFFAADFNTGTGFDAAVTNIAVDSTGNIYAAGDTKLKLNGTATAQHIWKLNNKGAHVSAFTCPDILAESGSDNLQALDISQNSIVVTTPQTLKQLDITSGIKIDAKNATVGLSDVLVDGTNLVLTSASTTAYNSVTNPRGVKKVSLNDIGTIDSTFSTNAGTGAGAHTGTVILSYSRTHYIVGNNTLTAGWNGGSNTTYKGLYRIAANGTIDGSFAVNIVLSDTTQVVAPFCVDEDDNIYFGGPVTSINANAVTPWRLYKISKTGAFIKEFNLFDDKVLDAKLLENGTLFVGGEFKNYGKVPVGYAVLIDSKTGAIKYCCGSGEAGSDGRIPTPTFFIYPSCAKSGAGAFFSIFVPGYSEEQYTDSANRIIDIYYTLDGTTPTRASELHMNHATEAVEAATTIKAIAVRTGTTTTQIDDSKVGTVFVPNCEDNRLPQVQFSPASSSDVPVTVTMTVPGHPNAVISYTANNADMTSPITYNPSAKPTFSTDTVVRAFATKSGYTNSIVAIAYYGATPTFSVNFAGETGEKVGLAATGKSSSDIWNVVNAPIKGQNYVLNFVTGNGPAATLQYACGPTLTATACTFVENNTIDTEWVAFPGTPKANDPMCLSALKVTTFNSLDRWHINDVKGGRYDLYFYAHGQKSIEACSVTLFKNGEVVNTKKTGEFFADWDGQGAWVDMDNYVLFDNVELQQGDKLSFSVLGNFSYCDDEAPYRICEPGEVQITYPAYLNGMQVVKTANEKLLPVVVTPDTGSYQFPFQVTMTHPTAGVDIWYTTNGATPDPTLGVTATNKQYTVPFTLDSAVAQDTAVTVTIKAKAFKTDYRASDVTTKAYTRARVEDVIFTPSSGEYAFDNFTVALSTATANAKIYYTVNGAAPVPADPPTAPTSEYVSSIAVNTAQVIKARARATGYTDSTLTQGSYDQEKVKPLFHSFPNVEDPCNIALPIQLALDTATAGAVSIYYTTDGTEATNASTLYNSATFITISAPTIIRARGYKTGCLPSDEYTVNINGGSLPLVTFSPASGEATTPVTVTLTCPGQPAALIRYAINGPVTSSSPTVASGGTVELTSSVTGVTLITAYATEAGFTDSCQSQATYLSPQLPVVEFSPVTDTPAPVYNAVMSVPDHSDATIYYTTDGREPTTSSTMYTVPVNFHQSVLVKAFATKTGYRASNISQAYYRPALNSGDLYYVGRTLDKAGCWENFGPGNSCPASDPKDYELELHLNLEIETTIDFITLYTSDANGNMFAGNQYTSTKRKPFTHGVDAYPLVVFFNGEQQNFAYSDTNFAGGKKYGPGIVKLKLFMQPFSGSAQFFTTKTSIGGNIITSTTPATPVPPPPPTTIAPVNLNFSVFGGNKSGPAAVGISEGDLWNKIGGGIGYFDTEYHHHPPYNPFMEVRLVDSIIQAYNGTVFNGKLTIRWDAPPSGPTHSFSQFATTGSNAYNNVTDNMLRTQLRANLAGTAGTHHGDHLNVEFRDIQPGKYDIWIYGENVKASAMDSGDKLTAYSPTSNGGTSPYNQSGFIEGVHYVKFTGVTAATDPTDNNRVYFRVKIKPIAVGMPATIAGLQLRKVA